MDKATIMKSLIHLEEAAMLILSIYILYVLKVEWWIYILLVFAPDISMLAYLAGNKTGAILYNFFHHKAVAVSVFLVGCLIQSIPLQIAGAVLFGHSSMDRIFGYGLKFFSGFRYTHLGQIGPANNNK